jgi:hypothetical protein
MLQGIETNRIIVGAYVDRASGGICPMLAAHRNGGRTSLASFARAWDRYTGAKRPRLATRRELRTLRALLDSSVADSVAAPAGSVAEAAAQIRAERASAAAHPPDPAAPVTPPVAGAITIRRLLTAAEQRLNGEPIVHEDERHPAQVS